MRSSIKLGLAVVLAAAVIFGISGVARAKDADGSTEQVYRLHMFHTHTGESIDVVYRVGDTYVPDGLAQLNHFLRDHRTQDVSEYDPKEFDTLHALMAKLGKPNGVIDIVCGYRTPWSNGLLRSRSSNSGVAEHSQHMLAKAIDIRVPGVSTAHLRDAALSLHAGGVGYYPINQFVHVDVGPERQWQYGGSRAHTRTIARATHRRPHRAAATAAGL
ncbi:MAG: DUF882 domain-containing protein [Edaphobacter sp.]|uniref:DUF882 domain-containing protein n=1 Tax=Edaphobacter sp. TaxID=1934404 RepID=UPI0023A653CD|nr:DUF882 domain-containing protein [Edaphobacter sp.]MDE1177059.1 DUF882 domain-containing protein [Edaphobacter sp.]